MVTTWSNVPDAGPYDARPWEPPPRRLDGLGVAVIALMGLNVLYGLAGIPLALARKGLLERLRDDPVTVTQGEIDASDLLVAGHGVVLVLLYLATATVFIVWLFRARRNLNRLRPDARSDRGRLGDHLRLGSGWAIGGWFIPLANLVIPFKVVNGVEQVSRPRPHGGAPVRGTHPVLRWWWAAWVMSMIVSRVVSRLPAETLDQEITRMSWMVVAAALWVVAAVLAVFVVRRITTHQRQLIAGQIPGGGWLSGA